MACYQWLILSEQGISFKTHFQHLIAAEGSAVQSFFPVAGFGPQEKNLSA